MWKGQGTNKEAVGEHRVSATEEKDTEVKQVVDDSLVEGKQQQRNLDLGWEFPQLGRNQPWSTLLQGASADKMPRKMIRWRFMSLMMISMTGDGTGAWPLRIG